MENWWQKIYFGNSVQDWSIAFGIIILAGIILYAFKKSVVTRLKAWTARTKNTMDDIIVAGIEKSLIPLVYFSIVYGAVSYLTIPGNIMSKIKVIFWIILMFYILRSVTAVVRRIIFGKIEEHTESEARKKQANGLVLLVNITIWIIGFVFLLDNLGYNIGTLIAGLGIGGIAIALAAQTILGDLFSYFVIFFDKPFEIGDFINFDDKSGTVEYIGLKTTRIRVLSGEQLVCSNKDLTDSRVHNYGRMETRRVVFKIEVTRQTTAALLLKIPTLVKDIILQTDGVRFDRGHFMSFGKTAYEFEFVYYILTSDFTIYMDKQQEVLIAVVESFEKNDIHLAYPTQTLWLEGQNGQSDQEKK